LAPSLDGRLGDACRAEWSICILGGLRCEHDHALLVAHWTVPGVRRFLLDGAVLTSAEISQATEDSGRAFAAAGYGLWLI
jgi:hypothetical protein